MKLHLVALVFSVAFSGLSPAIAAEKTVVLSVPDMYCASCPYIVKGAISKIEGVSAVSASIDDKTATVTFDDTVTTIETIRTATAGVGYPAKTVHVEGK